MIASPAARIRVAPRAGSIVDALTAEAAVGYLQTELYPQRAAWIALQLAPDPDPGWRALALSVARAEFGGDRWQPLPLDARTGVPVLVMPVFEADPAHALGIVCVDLIAVDPADRARAYTRIGACEALGECEVERAIVDGRAVRWHRDALGWARAGGDALVWAGDDTGPAHFAPLFAGGWRERAVLLGAREIIADDNEHGIEIAAAIKRARKAALTPPPIVMVADGHEEAA
jgi:hypothetical protein